MKKFLGIVSLLYSSVIIYALVSDILKNYLAPNMHIYVIISIPILIVIGITLLLIKDDDQRFKVSDLILLLPLIMLIIGGNGKLGVSLASNRIIDSGKNNIDNIETIDIDEVNEEVDLTNVFFDINDDNYGDVASYITYSTSNREYTNKTISVRGMILTNNNMIPDKYFIIGKYQISCCAADAKFSFYYAKYDKSKLKNNKWYQLEGVLKPGKDINSYDIMYIDVINIKEIDENSEEYYFYPCYYYDDKCSNVIKYNFEY